MNIIVQKFGGTSVGDINRIKHAAQIIKSSCSEDIKIIAVVSAMAGTTNKLSTQCNELSNLTTAEALREYDVTLSSGEIITASMLALELQNIGLKAKSLQGWQIPIFTDEQHGNAQITKISKEKIEALLQDDIIPVITGFQGISHNNNVTTLGRGGSDTSAAIIAAAFGAIRCDIYTDVLGVYTADPRIIHDAKKIDIIDCQELFELCSHGTKVLHPRAALAALRYNLNLKISSSFDQVHNNGTITIKNTKKMEHAQITAITYNKNLLSINIACNNSAALKVAQTLLKDNILISNIIIGESNLEIITEIFYNNRCNEILSNLQKVGVITKYTINIAISSISVIGSGLRNHSKIAIEILSLLNTHNIDILNLEITDLRISFLTQDDNIEKAIQLIHQYYFINT
ncbi:MAG: aspartate kinase [Rickettsiaceae bacterium]|nr:aspartate kinase [Rickettsiaceae bacterium]